MLGMLVGKEFSHGLIKKLEPIKRVPVFWSEWRDSNPKCHVVKPLSHKGFLILLHFFITFLQ